MAKTRILIMDDDTAGALELRGRLIGLGYDLLEPSAPGGEALELVARNRPDLILTGRHPDDETARQILEASGLPVVFLTDDAGRLERRRPGTALPVSALAPPFDDRLLELTIETALLRRRIECERQSWAVERGDLLRRVLSAQEGERKRIARELHDALGQALTSALVKLAGLESSSEKRDLAALVAELRRDVAGALEELRRLSRGLHPAVLDAMGLETALERLADDFRAHGVAVDVHIRGFEPPRGRLSRDAEAALFRIAQEALTNVARHAEARTASLIADRTDSTLSLIIEDDGRGIAGGVEGQGGGLGLLGIRERAELLGGTFTLETSEYGTTLFIRVPLGPVVEAVGLPVGAE